MGNKLRLTTLALVALLPSALARPCYRWFFGYKIGKRVRLGFSIIDALECTIDDDVSIGHLNVFTRIGKLSIGDHTRIGVLNIFRGGDEIRIGRYCEILRLNEINSIPEPDTVNPVDPRFLLGNGSIIAASHKIDFTDKVEFGKCVILGGRNSSLWTHNRQKTKQIDIGEYSYLGSEIRVAPGAAIAARCIVGMGSVITKAFDKEYFLIAGVPAAEVKELDEEQRFLCERKTRKDLPDGI
jgi:carbonic anhydrase/acetyltransferase-like protein (isoleucine patch superfamily)